MGFSYAKRNKKLYIYEQQEVISSRHRYLRTMKKLREEGKSIVYTDETWVNAHHGHDMVWVDVDGSGGSSRVERVSVSSWFMLERGKGGYRVRNWCFAQRSQLITMKR